MFDDFTPGMHSHADQMGWNGPPEREHRATEVGRIVARYIADTSSFDRGNARVKAGLASQQGAVRRTGASWANYGKYGVLGVGAAVVGSLKSFANFDRNMNIFQANTEAGAKTMKAAREEAVRLGADARFPAVTAAHVADTLVELSKAGLSATQSIKTLEPVMLLGTAGQMDFADAGAIAANAMNAFGLKAGDIPRLVDDIAGAALKSSSDVKDIAEAFRYTSSAAAGLGMPIDQVTTLIGQLSNLGLKGDMAGTSMRMFFTSLAKPRSNKAFALMDDLGLLTKKGKSKFFDEKGEIKSMDKIIALWRNATANMKGGRQARIGAEHTIFGVRGMNVARVMDQGVAAYNRMHKASTKVGSANRLAAANTKGLYGAYQRLVNVVQTLGLQLGEELAPAATKVLDALSGVAGVISKNQGLVRAIARAILLVTGAWLAWRGTMILSNIIMGISRTAMILYRAAIVAMYAPTQLLRIAQMQLNAAFMANPIGIIIAAIIVAILILRHFGVGIDDIRRIMTRAWSWIVTTWGRIKRAFMTGVGAVLGFLKANWPYIVGAMLGPLGLAIAAIYKNWGRIKSFFLGLKNTIIGAIRSAMNSAIDAIKSAAGRAYSAAKDLGSKIIHAIVDGIKSAPGAITDAILGAIPGGKKAKGIVGKAIGVVAHRAGGGAVGAGGAYVVGEKGPELFVPGSNGQVVPNHALGGQSGNVHVENLNVRSEDDIYSIASVLGRRMRFA